MKVKTETESKELKVLVLEDSLRDMELMREQLLTAGYRLDLTHVENEEGFTALLRETSFDLILADFKLPGFDAFGALEICRELCPETPFICVSGTIGEETAVELLKLGAVDYVLKDRHERLPIAVKRALEEARVKADYQKTSESLRKSESQFKSMFENMASASCLDEIIYENGKAVDYIILDMNPAYNRIIGKNRGEVIGIKASELYGTKKIPFLETYAQVAETGEPAEFEAYFPPLDKYLHVTAGCPQRGFFSTVFSDITQRKQAEEALRLSEKHKAFLAQTAFEMVELTSIQEIYTYTVHKLYELFEGHSIVALLEYDPSQNRWKIKHTEGIGKKTAELSRLLGFDINKLEGEISTKYYEKITSGRLEEMEFDFPGLFNDRLSAAIGNTVKKMFSIEKMYSIAFQQDTQIIGNVTFTTNTKSEPINTELIEAFIQQASIIIKKQKTEEKLKESEDRFKKLASFTFEGIIIHNNAITIDVNQSAVKMLGYERDELTGMHLFNLIHPVSHAIVKANLSKKVATPYQIKVIRKDGSTFDAEIEAKDIFYNGEYFRVACIRDITEHIQLEEQAIKLSRIVEQSSISVMITNIEGIIEYVNPFFTELTGYCFDEVKGKKTNILKSGHHSKAFYKEVWDTILSGNNWEGEFLNKKKSGELYWAKAIISSIVNREGVITNFVSIKQDITDRKRTLEALVAAKEKAQESDKLKTAFINNISHEIRTPLNGILGFGKLMLDEGISLEDKEKMLAMVQQSSNRLMNTVRDYMDMARIFSGTMEVHKKEFLLQPFFEEITKDVMQLCTSKSISFETDNHHDADLVLDSDPELIGKTLHALLDNALKFTERGSIGCGYKLNEGFVEFYVKDTGRGIAPKMLDEIFTMFTQEDPSDKRGHEGSGLGLSIASGLVKLLGGAISATSEKGKGSSFTFTVPYVVREHADKTLPAGKKNTSPVRKPLVLLAEDEESNYFYMEVVLRLAGCDYLLAKNGEEAVSLCKQYSDISLVLMDIKMPVMNGLEATTRIREFRPELPIIATTAYAQTGDEQRFLAAGCDGYLAKPIQKEKLFAILKQYSTLTATRDFVD